MHKYFISLILLLFLYSCSEDNPIVPEPPPNPADTLGTVIGRVIDLSGMGIKDVQVTLQSNLNYYSGFSDTTGNYSIPNIPAGNYSVYTYKNGYTVDSLNITINQGDTIQANFQLSQSYWYRLNANANSLNFSHGYHNLYVNPQQVIFASTRNGTWMGGSLGGFIKTTNSGGNWQTVIHNGGSTEIYRITDNNLYIFTTKGQDGNGNYIGENKVYRSADFGGNWQELLNFNLSQINGHKIVAMNNGLIFLNIHGVQYPNVNPIFNFYKSANQGGSWDSYSPVNQYNVRALNKTASGKIYIANYSDSLYYSVNGSDWTLRIVSSNVIRNNILNSVILPTGEIIASVSSNYNISYDDGENWSPITPSLVDFPLPYRFKFNSNNDILAIVNNQSNNAFGVYKSTDKCQTWLLIDDGLPEFYEPVSMALFDDYGFLLLKDGYLYRTSRKTTETMNDNIEARIKNAEKIK
jgi:hypothetical protein